MNSWKVILATLVIFGAGVMTGGLLVNYAVHTNLVLPAPKPIPVTIQGTNPWLQRARELLRRMDRELDLTPEQHQRIEKLITDSAERTSNNPSVVTRLGANVARIRQTLDGMWVKTMGLIRPMRRAKRAASGYENAESTLDQKKNTLAAASDRLKRSNSHSASRD